ncbi:Gfo/Idh/MocA family protein [Lachnoclostridium sp. Marseille-P6806]|uniref:Gfo/Idh/MocA family protein n=1 Tax=Lachnoclostridium sp. Marseille-P6806 TaxID=2364793 RepID=UPI00102F9FB4|nr:Gfo/Idh/MocA family oxidoreductase [Lachnoclostridium sp. Marseille-P6806]
MKVAVIGCGTIATNQHIPAYMKNERTEIRYFCDILPERARAAAEKNGVGTVVTDYREVLRDPEVQAISVCTPNHMHAQISIDALRAGKDVLCEKPAARSYEEALAMQRAQHETGRILNIGVVNRFNDAVNMVKSFIDDGKLGEVYHVIAHFRAHRSIPGLGGPFTDKAIAGGGALIDWGVHYLDIVMYCCGDPAPVTVSGETYCRLGRDIRNYAYETMWAGPPKYDGVYDVDDSVSALIRTEGPVISVEGAWAQNIGPAETYIDFIGDKGGIRLDYGAKFTYYSSMPGGEHGALLELRPEFHMRNQFENEINAFADAVENRRRMPSHIDTFILTQRIMQAVYDSAEAHRELVLAGGRQ